MNITDKKRLDFLEKNELSVSAICILFKTLFEVKKGNDSISAKYLIEDFRDSEKCKWKLTRYPETYKIPFKVNTSCNNKFRIGKVFFKFCPHCGKEIEEIEND